MLNKGSNGLFSKDIATTVSATTVFILIHRAHRGAYFKIAKAAAQVDVGTAALVYGGWREGLAAAVADAFFCCRLCA